MRLISTLDLELHVFPDNAVPPYTILSHTWGSEEVSYHDMLNPTHKVKSSRGYQKIRACAKVSRDMWYDYTWVDTCCINKTSSAELSESINSMYAWYRQAGVCLAYLEDFHGDRMSQVTNKNRWFTRGWTLQELIAPSEVVFYSASWERFGCRSESKTELEKLTSISTLALSFHRGKIPVAEKMRWAAHRTTTRIEDVAYCMLGIFGVSMPLIYGEGERAFQRLQEEIIRTSDDVSIFLWQSPEPNHFSYRCPFAVNPSEFANSNIGQKLLYPLDEPFEMTNKGLRMVANLVPAAKVLEGSSERSTLLDDLLFCVGGHIDNIFFLPFDHPCTADEDGRRRTKTPTIILRRTHDEKLQFARAYAGFPVEMEVMVGDPNYARHFQRVTFFISSKLALLNNNCGLMYHDLHVTGTERRFITNGPTADGYLADCEVESIVGSSLVWLPSIKTAGLEAAFAIRSAALRRRTVNGFCLVLRQNPVTNTLHIYFFQGYCLQLFKWGRNITIEELFQLNQDEKTSNLLELEESLQLRQVSDSLTVWWQGMRMAFTTSKIQDVTGALFLHLGIAIVGEGLDMDSTHRMEAV